MSNIIIKGTNGDEQSPTENEAEKTQMELESRLTPEHHMALDELANKIMEAVDSRIMFVCNQLGAGITKEMDIDEIRSKVEFACIDIIHYHRDPAGEMHDVPGWYIYQYGELAAIIGDPRRGKDSPELIEIPILLPVGQNKKVPVA